MTISLKVAFDNQIAASPATLALLELNLSAAVQRWSDVLSGNASVSVSFSLVEATSSGRAQGGPSSSIFAGGSNGSRLFEGGAAHELRGAPDVATLPDINIFFQRSYLDAVLWLDPTPFDSGSDLPAGKTDSMSILMHEFGHGLGFTGYRRADGTSVNPDLSTFDQHIVAKENGFYFGGPNSAKIYGGPVPITSGNIYHVGNSAPAPGADLVPDLMNGVVFQNTRYVVSDLDIAMLADLGLGTIRSDTLDGPQYTATLNAGAGLDTVVFRTASQSAAIKAFGQEVIVTTTNGQAPVTVTLQNVERVSFTDKIVAFDDDGNAGKAYRLYEAAFNRTPDQAGLSYWTHYLDGSQDLTAVAQGFVGSAEFKSVYGAAPSNAVLVNTFYANVLDRAGDAEGVAYWTGVLARGVSVPVVLAGFSESPENQAAVAPKIVGGISLSLDYFA